MYFLFSASLKIKVIIIFLNIFIYIFVKELIYQLLSWNELTELIKDY